MQIFGEVLKGVQKASTIVKTGLSGADIVIGTSHALEDFGCSDYVCESLEVIGSLSSAVGMVLGNIPTAKHLTVGTGSVTLGCRSVRYDCKQYGTFSGWTVAAGQGIKRSVKFTVNP